MPKKMREALVLARDGVFRKSSRPSLRLRLFAFLALFAAAIILALFAVLSASGILSAGLSESRLLLQNELDHIAGYAAGSYGSLTAEGLALSGRLCERVDGALRVMDMSASELKTHPGLLTDILRNCFAPAVSALTNNRASGVFVVLDATVNSESNSRAGFFIRNMEPNALIHSDPSLYYLRGPIALARESGMHVLPQWKMEFPVSDGDFFHIAMESADGSVPAARTYYWNPAETLIGDYDAAMLLCVPMIASDGTVIGICGFDVDELLFKMQYFPDTSVFAGMAVMFAPVMEDGSLSSAEAMFSGIEPLHTDGRLAVTDYGHGLSVFSSNGTRYVGLSAPVRLYSKNAVHDRLWAMAVVVPEAELSAYAARKSGALTALLIALLSGALGSAVFLSRHYLAPVMRGLEQITKGGAMGFTPVNIPEIDDLMEFLAQRDREHEAELSTMKKKLSRIDTAQESYVMPSREAYAAFLKNLATLTRTEREVFDLYRQGHRAKDMPKLMYRSANTIKTHNKNIYGKLCVFSREELIGFIRMMDAEEGENA